ncbi:putative odorant receptor 83c isoform X2 [Culex pipiens pallens]|uniref:putative odorant receptor 83c isoform X2 n=1 Tax=Culex pipiens pallens TaxID=42434 RepID=UPI001952AD0B|nr:putative odorant receptor 83c isoform X2 [Culex pipiens pallens]
MVQVKARETLPMRWFDKSYQMYDYNLLFIRWMADFSGVDMMVDNYRFNYRTAICIGTTLMGTINSIYSFVFYYPSLHKICEVIVMFGILIQGVPKLYFGYIHREFYKLQYGRLRTLHYKYRDHEKLNANLLLLMERIHVLSKLLAIVFIFGGLGYSIYPMYMYWAHNELVLMIAMRVPWVDGDSYTGYIVTSAVQMVMIVITCTGLSAADTVILLFVANLIAYVDVFKNELDELNAMLNEEIRDEKKIRQQVRTICTQHQDIIEYESDLDERYIVISFGQVIGSVTSMSVSIFLVYMDNFIPGYALVVASFFQLLEFCLLGTILTVKNEDIVEAIYSTNWYLLQEPERRCFGLMLHKSQNFTEMTIGGFAPLNLGTFVAIMNRIYSYFMMLISFIE